MWSHLYMFQHGTAIHYLIQQNFFSLWTSHLQIISYCNRKETKTNSHFTIWEQIPSLFNSQQMSSSHASSIFSQTFLAQTFSFHIILPPCWLTLQLFCPLSVYFYLIKILALFKTYIYIHYTHIRSSFPEQKGYKETTHKIAKGDIHHLRMAK